MCQCDYLKEIKLLDLSLKHTLDTIAVAQNGR